MPCELGSIKEHNLFGYHIVAIKMCRLMPSKMYSWADLGLMYVAKVFLMSKYSRNASINEISLSHEENWKIEWNLRVTVSQFVTRERWYTRIERRICL